MECLSNILQLLRQSAHLSEVLCAHHPSNCLLVYRPTRFEITTRSGPLLGWVAR